MNSKLITISALSLLFFAVGCKKQPVPVSDGSAINVTVAIAGVEQKASKTAFATGDKFGMWVVQYIKSDKDAPANDVPGTLRPMGNYFDNICFTMGAAEFTPASSVYYPSPLIKVDLYAVSPYDTTMSHPTYNSMLTPTAFEWSVKDTQTVAAKVIASDLMSAIFTKAYSGIAPAPALEFHHRLAKVNVNITVPAKFREKRVLALRNVRVLNTRLKATVDLTKMPSTTVFPIVSVTNNPATEIQALRLSAPADNAVAGVYKYEAIVIPQTVAAVVPIIKLEIDVENMGTISLLCYTSASGLTFEQTNQTTFNVDVEDQGSVVIGEPKILPWGSTADVNTEASRPSKLLIKTDGTGIAAAVARIVKASLMIDHSPYVADVTIRKAVAGETDTLECTFMQPENLWGDKLKSVVFKDAAGSTVTTAAFNPAFPTEGLNIVGDPTLYNYKEVITTATFN